MQKNRPYQTVHYTGVPWHLSNGMLRYPPVIEATHMVNIEAIADGGKKSFEYNYVIPVGVPGVAHVWEYAGLYQAAHSYGENDLAFGCLLLLGVDNFGKPNQVWQPISEEMVYAVRWINKMLREQGFLSLTHQLLPHASMPEAATPCPGVPAIERIPDMRVPLQDPPPIPTPEPTGEDVLRRILKPTFGGSPELPHLGLFDSGCVRPLVSEDLIPLEKNPNEEDGKFPCPDKGQYKRLCDWANIPVGAL